MKNHDMRIDKIPELAANDTQGKAKDLWVIY